MIDYIYNNFNNNILCISSILFVIFQICENINLTYINNYYNHDTIFFQIQFKNIIHIIICLLITFIIKKFKNSNPDLIITYNNNNSFIYFITGLIDAFVLFTTRLQEKNMSQGLQNILILLSFPLTIIVTPFIFKKYRENLVYYLYHNICIISLYIFGIIMLIISNIVNNILSVNDFNKISLIIFIFAPILNTISWLFKQHLFTHSNSIIRLLLWNTINMFLFTIIFWFIETSQYFGNININYLEQQTLYNGIQCFINQYNNCNYAWILELSYSLISFITQLCAIIFCKYTSSSDMWSIKLFTICIYNFILIIILKYISNIFDQTYNLVYTFFGFLISIFGIIIYSKTSKLIRNIVYNNDYVII